MENKIISGIWIGDRLTNIQKLCIRSFQDHGHIFHLYTYGNVEGVPDGTIIKNAEQIVSSSERPRFKNDANFSDFFRARLTWERGGWYVDMDIVCLREFDFPQERVFVSEYQFGADPQDRRNIIRHPVKPQVNGCIVKIPARDRMTGLILDRINHLDPLDPALNWSAIGPMQYRWGTFYCNYSSFVKHPDVFDSLWPSHLTAFANEPMDWNTPEKAYAIHLRTSFWDKHNLKLKSNGEYPSGSWFERLKTKHGVK